jgi:hypothetical protein
MMAAAFCCQPFPESGARVSFLGICFIGILGVETSAAR